MLARELLGTGTAIAIIAVGIVTFAMVFDHKIAKRSEISNKLTVNLPLTSLEEGQKKFDDSLDCYYDKGSDTCVCSAFVRMRAVSWVAECARVCNRLVSSVRDLACPPKSPPKAEKEDEMQKVMMQLVVGSSFGPK